MERETQTPPPETPARVALIANPNAGSASEALDALAESFPEVEVFWTEGPGHAERLGASLKAARVVACGGDGTLHEVVNGLMTRAPEDRPTLGLIPMGTGNDLARTLELPRELSAALALAARGEHTTPLDVIEVTLSQHRVRHVVNALNAGNAEHIAEVASSEAKQTWGVLAYVVGGAHALASLTCHTMTMRLDDAVLERDVLGVVLANGRTLGGGVVAAPDADPGDGLIDVIIIRAGELAYIAQHSAQAALGAPLSGGLIEQVRAREVHLTASPLMGLRLDGEQARAQPLSARIVPGALQVVVDDPGLPG